ncbi:MAG: hypothetical protein WBV73_02805 [Phormidium sp.]
MSNLQTGTTTCVIVRSLITSKFLHLGAKSGRNSTTKHLEKSKKRYITIASQSFSNPISIGCFPTLREQKFFVAEGNQGALWLIASTLFTRDFIEWKLRLKSQILS